MKEFEITPVVIGVLCKVPERIVAWIKIIGIECSVEMVKNGNLSGIDIISKVIKAQRKLARFIILVVMPLYTCNNWYI